MANVQALVVGGGGGGGSNRGGGGGGGGYQYNASLTVNNIAYTVTVGAGGAQQAAGSNSVFSTITANGGGDGGDATQDGTAGGCGGGSSLKLTGGGAGSQGGNGGVGRANTGSFDGAGGGGGGAGATGGNSPDVNTGGTGGNGTANSISGTSVTYAGGGGGCGGACQGGVVVNVAAGGTGGGGASSSYNGTTIIDAVPGTANTGGGGGGRGNAGGTTGSGGSGIVIIRYVTADFGTCTGGTITTSGSDTIHTFTSSGTMTFVAKTGGEWTAQDTFEGATDEANLTAWSGGTGWSAAWVNSATNVVFSDTATSYGGTTSARVNSNGGNTFYTRVLSSTVSTTGIMYVAMRKSSTSAGENAFSLRSSVGGRVSVRLTAAGNIDAGASTRILTGFTANTWYVIRITFDVGAGTYTVAYSTDSFGSAGSWSSESASISMTSSGNIDRVGVGGDTGANSWVDYISGTSPFGGAADTSKFFYTT